MKNGLREAKQGPRPDRQEEVTDTKVTEVADHASKPRFRLPEAFCNHALEGEARWWLGSLAVIKATAAQTASQFTMVEVLENVGETPLHVHHREDESFHVLEGEIEFEIGGRNIMAGPGSFLFAPRDVPHRYMVKRGPARMLFLFTPGGSEELLRATSVPAAERRIPLEGEGVPDMETFPDVVSRYGCELLG